MVLSQIDDLHMTETNVKFIPCVPVIQMAHKDAQMYCPILLKNFKQRIQFQIDEIIFKQVIVQTDKINLSHRKTFLNYSWYSLTKLHCYTIDFV